MRFVGKLALVLFACKLDDGTFECGDWTCPNGTACLNPPEGNVHCVSLLCGNGVVDPNEQCDGEVAQSCLDLQYDAGYPACTTLCTVDTTKCEQIGFETIYEGGSSVRRFCAYEDPPGNVVAHFFQDDRLVRFDGTAEELPGSFEGVPKDIACVKDLVGAIAIDTLATYSQGTWTRRQPKLVDGTQPVWEQITETDVDLTAIGWNTLASATYGGVIVALDNAGFNIEANTTNPVGAIESRPNQRIVAQESGALLQRAANGTWSSVNTSTTPFYGLVTSLGLLATGDVIGSNTRAIMRMRSGVWTPIPTSPGRIVATSPSTVFVSGSNGLLAHFDSFVFSHAPGIGVLDDMWLSSRGELYASRAAELLHASGFWFELSSQGTMHAIATVANLETLITFRVGTLGLNNAFSIVDSNITTVSVSGGLAFGVGGSPPNGMAARLDLSQPATWPTSDVPIPNTTLHGVVAAGDRAWAVGTNGRVVAYNGAWGTPVDTMLGVTLRGIGRTQAGELIAVGDAGTIATSLDGIAWTRVDLALALTLRGVFTRGEDVYVVGDRGTIAQRVGATWSVVPSSTTRDLYAIHGTDTRLFAVGDRAIVEFDGTRWSPVRTPLAGTTFTTVIARPPHVYVGSATKSFVLYRP